MANLPVSGVALACALRLPASALRRHCGLCVLPAKQTWRCALRALSGDDASTPHNGLNAFSGGLWRCFAGAAFLPIARSSRKAGRSAACAAQRVWPPSRGGKKNKTKRACFSISKNSPVFVLLRKERAFCRSLGRGTVCAPPVPPTATRLLAFAAAAPPQKTHDPLWPCGRRTGRALVPPVCRWLSSATAEKWCFRKRTIRGL